MVSSPPTDPKPDLRRFLDQARRLRDEYEAGFQRYKTDNQVTKLIGHFGVEAAYEAYGIPKGISRDALNAFLKGWESSQPYRDFRQRFELLLDMVATFLGDVSEAVPSLRPPGNSAKLLAKLARIRAAVRLDTKMRNLIVALEDIDTRKLIRNQDIPVKRPRQRVRQTSAKARSLPSSDPALAWSLAGVILSVFIGLALGVYPIIGWGSIIVGGLATVALVVSRRFWEGPILRLTSPRRRK